MNMTEAIKRAEAMKIVRAFVEALDERARNEWDVHDKLSELRKKGSKAASEIYVTVDVPEGFDRLNLVGMVDLAKRDPRIKSMSNPMVSLEELYVDTWPDYGLDGEETNESLVELDPRQYDEKKRTYSVRFVDERRLWSDDSVLEYFEGLFEGGVVYGLETVCELLDSIVFNSVEEHLSEDSRRVIDAASRFSALMLEVRSEKRAARRRAQVELATQRAMERALRGKDVDYDPEDDEEDEDEDEEEE